MEAQPDIVIRGGTVVDGTGRPAFVADLAVCGDQITRVEPLLEVQGKEEIDARGLVVAPGWIDAHTHLDAQWSWDPYLSPSPACGVTTCIMGNCGIGFAPCQQDRREFLSFLVEAVEDIPGRVIAEGLKYDFETFEEFLDSVDRTPLAADVAVLIGHSAVRSWVMGKRANLADRPKGAAEHPVKSHEVKAMAALVRDAIAKGALGFSTSRLLVHRDPKGVLTPGALAANGELQAICDAIAEAGGGIFQMSSDWVTYDDFGTYSKQKPDRARQHQKSELEWMMDVTQRHGRKVGFTFNCAPGQEGLLNFLGSINRAGGVAKGQCFTRAQGFLQTFGARMHLFIVSKTYHRVAARCHKTGDNLLASLKEHKTREVILREAAEFLAQDLPRGIAELSNALLPFERVFRWTQGYEPETGKDDIASLGAKEGKSPLEFAYDFMLSGGVLWKPFAAYEAGNCEPMGHLLHQADIIPGFADAGAHGTVFQDSAAASHLLTHWTRDRTRGPRMALEHAVKKQTKEVAELFGLSDRGVLAPGKKADINIIDLQNLKMCEPFLAQDMPLKQQRWMQHVEGYHTTLLSGKPTFRRGLATGILPGHLVRNPHRIEAVWQNISASVSGPFESGLLLKDDESKLRALDGSGKAGASAVARVLRDTIENGTAEPRGNLRSRL
mmetsp:Transcript_13234/g.31093  ORF Transcript_13234/g.31093 Transcript_13234/m.31093 type:complete len:667 (+) Transcript_13234:125-2125(+)